MRIGLFGGTFDPPHEGHATIAAAARDQLALDLVEMTPSFAPPHRDDVTAGPWERFAMVVLACAGLDRVVPSPRELARGGVSYTVDTLREIAAEHPGAELFLVIGADSYDDLPRWREPQAIDELAHLVVVARPGSDGLDRARPGDRGRIAAPGSSGHGEPRRVFALDCPLMPVRARTIRAKVAAGEEEIEGLAPAVELYIKKTGLYRSRAPVRDR